MFTDLARKAAVLARRPSLLGWLHRSAQFAARDIMRAEHRRQSREQAAHTMEAALGPNSPEPDWEKVRPLVDRALSEMDERDRDAILLRFFEEQPFASIGAQLRLSENAARMRVDRALAKLAAAPARRGITSTSAALGAALANQAGAAVPAGLASTVTGAALTHSAAGVGLWAFFMSMSKPQLASVAAVTLGGFGGYAIQGKTNDELRRELIATQELLQPLAELRAENRRLANTLAEVEILQRDDTELARLEREVAEAQDRLERHIQVARSRAQEDAFRAEIDRINREGNALVEKYKSLKARAGDGSLSKAQRSQAEGDAAATLEQIKGKQREKQELVSRAKSAHPQIELGGSRLYLE